MKYIFVTGGVTSSLGKGIVSASLAALLEARGYKVRIKKMDPYLNVDPGTMSPLQHGEVFVTDDGAETDLDIGHYERFTNNICNKNDSISAGKIYSNVIEKERKGKYLGQTIQVIPHVTNEIKEFINNDITDEDFLICEIGGTVGDIEANPFIEAIRQIMFEKKKEEALNIHLTYVPYLQASEEIKTKPTQHSVRMLQSLGVFPGIIICRSTHEIPEDDKKKISLFCNVDIENVIPAYTQKDIYTVPLAYHYEGLDRCVLNHFKLSPKTNNIVKWEEITNKINALTSEKSIKVAIIGKYVSLKDAYKSIYESFNHCAINQGIKVETKLISSEEIEDPNYDFKKAFEDVDGVLVAGGFGGRGVEGKIKAVQYVRENNIPFFGICFGLQMAVIEYARNVLGIKNANTTEVDENCEPLVTLVTKWVKEDGTVVEADSSILNTGGSMRLGSYKCKVLENTKTHQAYGSTEVHERHRHRFEVNPAYVNQLKEAGLVISGICEENGLTEIIELPNHTWFVAGQFHPELKSKLFKPHPLFMGFVEACFKNKK